MEKKKRGFAAMTAERQREIARMGGLACPPEKRGFTRDRELAIRAAKLGGASTPPERRGFAANRELAVRAGKLGGIAARKKVAE